jgi:non-specific serine/threonine protein kinase
MHEQRFLHRDIKPDNIYIASDGRPVLIDFGSARQEMAQHGGPMTAVVSDGFTPFEQYSEGGAQGPWTDLYALAATFYAAITGRKPPSAASRMGGPGDPCICLAAAYRQKYSAGLLRSIDAALSVRASDRPQSTAEWVELLEAAIEEPPPSRFSSPTEILPRGFKVEIPSEPLLPPVSAEPPSALPPPIVPQDVPPTVPPFDDYQPEEPFHEEPPHEAPPPPPLTVAPAKKGAFWWKAGLVGASVLALVGLGFFAWPALMRVTGHAPQASRLMAKTEIPAPVRSVPPPAATPARPRVQQVPGTPAPAPVAAPHVGTPPLTGEVKSAPDRAAPTPAPQFVLVHPNTPTPVRNPSPPLPSITNLPLSRADAGNDRLRKLGASYIEAGNALSIEDEMRYYAPTVDFYGEGPQTAREIRAELSRQREHGASRNFKVTGITASLYSAETDTGIIRVRYQFDVSRSGDSSPAGEAEAIIHFTGVLHDPKVVEVSETRMR